MLVPPALTIYGGIESDMGIFIGIIMGIRNGDVLQICNQQYVL